jgi:microcystin-dependent protein
MGTPFLAEIKIISWNFAPQGWAFCNGQFLPINQNQALFSILGTTYGGNGQTTFALPDFRGRVPVHTGPQNTLGTKGGEEFHTITQQETPTHNHFLQASKTAPGTATLNGNMFAQASGGIYGNPSNLTNILPTSITNVGGSQPHEDRQPFLVLNFIIALVGIFPSRN